MKKRLKEAGRAVLRVPERGLHTFRRRQARERLRSVAPKSIVFVCYGNIIRSPMAEALLKRCLGPAMQEIIWVGSAGLAAKNARQADERAIRVCRDFGVSLDGHRAVPLTPELVERSDVIFVMDYLTEAQLIGLYPTARRKTFLLGGYSAVSKGKLEIDDPYWGTMLDVMTCYEVLEQCIKNVLKQKPFEQLLKRPSPAISVHARAEHQGRTS